MKRILSLTVLLVCLFINTALAEFVMPVYNKDLGAIKSSVMTIMSMSFPQCYLEAQSENMLQFKGMNQNIFGKDYQRFAFTFSSMLDASGATYTRVVLQVYTANDNIFLKNDYSVETDRFYDNILITIKAVNDGAYYYGFTPNRTKIKNVEFGSPAYEAGLRDGDVITFLIDVNGKHKMSSTLLNRVWLMSNVTLETKAGKTITMRGIYHSPEEIRQNIANTLYNK
jgi:hypothetical protein